jgi:probable lipoprotein NlpC
MIGLSQPLEVQGVRFHGDCSGFVEAVYQAEGIPFHEAVTLAPEDAGSTVAAIYRTVAAHGALFTTELPPLPGDLAFWNDTYDRNGNGEADDPLTHVGIVEEVSPEGTVTFLHRGARGVTRGRMNLRMPDVPRDSAGKVLNTRLRVTRRDDPAGTRYLAGQLFAAFGRFDPPLLAAALDGSDRLSLDALGLGEGEPEGLPIPAGTPMSSTGPVEDEP